MENENTHQSQPANDNYQCMMAGVLKSIANRSKGREDLMRVFAGGFKKRGLSSLLILQSKHTLSTSSIENGKFLE